MLVLASCNMGKPEQVTDARTVYSQPDIYPDYVGVTIPAGIAPLDFCMRSDSARLIDAVFTGTVKGELHAQGSASTCIDPEQWQQLLTDNRGGSLYVTVSAKYDDGWRSYVPFGIDISTDSIDYGITYRLIEPGYEAYTKMGIYETRLQDSHERPLLVNTQFRGCVNCHSYNHCNPDYQSLHIRGDHGATLLQHPGQDGQLRAYDTKTAETLGLCVYPYWHPTGRYIAYSTNRTRQGFHSGGHKIVEVIDQASDLQVYDVEHGELIVSDLLRNPDVLETYPTFSPDGRTLYFCAARQLHDSIEVRDIRYDLCSISFDPETGTLGSHIDTLLQVSTEGKSIAFPRPSYDGRFICFTLADYGNFHVWHPEADLYLLDLRSHEVRPMTAANSPDSESVHNWSSNSRWMVFGSRRDDGLYTRPYFCHIDTAGQVSKAFMLPQRSPKEFYTSRFFSYNIPDFITHAVPLDSRQAADIIVSPERTGMKARVQP